MTTINISLRSKEKSDYIRNLLEDPKLCKVNRVTPNVSKNTNNSSDKSLPYIVNRIDNYKVSIQTI